MIKEILADIATKVGLFESIPLVEVIEGKTMFYKGRSEYEVINIEKGGAYFIIEDMSQDRVEGLTCGEDIVRTYEIYLSINIKRKDLDCDDEFAEDRVVNDIIKKITGKDRTLAKILGVRNVETFVEGVDNEGSFMSKNYMYSRLKIEVQSTFAASCLTSLC